MLSIRSIKDHTISEIIIDKSRFITDVFPVESISEATRKLELIKELHPKANHHCYAYIIGYSSEQQKFSDDGEPGGTAGMPILNVLKHEKITNIIVIVTRYFGGVKLGTGGLIRAYTTATKNGLECGEITQKLYYDLYQITVSYSLADSVKYLLQNKASIAEITYQQQVTINFYIIPENKPEIEKELINLLNENIQLEYIKSNYI